MEISLNGKIFNDSDDVKSYLIQFLLAKIISFMNMELWHYLKDGKRSSTKTDNT